MTKVGVGIVSGRFQPLHNGHMDYLLAAKKQCQLLVIGITCPDSGLAADGSPDLNRVKPLSNPLNYWERLVMVRDSLLEAGIARSEFEIVPFPMSYDETLLYNAPEHARYYVTIFDEWSKHKLSKIEMLGFDVEILWEQLDKERDVTATKIRTSIIDDTNDWKAMVPRAVAIYIGTPEFRKRLLELSK